MSDNQQSPKSNKNVPTPKMIVITPDQLAKLGLTAHIQNAIRPQNSPTIKTSSSKADISTAKKSNDESNKFVEDKIEDKATVPLTKEVSDENIKAEIVSRSIPCSTTSVDIQTVLPQQSNKTEIKEIFISAHSEKQADDSVFIAPQPKTNISQNFPKMSASSSFVIKAAASTKVEKAVGKEKQSSMPSYSQEKQKSKPDKSQLLSYYATQGKIKKTKLTDEHKHSKKLKAVSSNKIYSSKKKIKLASCIDVKTTSTCSTIQNVNLVNLATPTAKVLRTEESQAFVFKIPAPVKSRAFASNKISQLSPERKIETGDDNANNREISSSKKKSENEGDIDKIVHASVSNKTEEVFVTSKNTKTEKVAIDEITVETCKNDETGAGEFKQNEGTKNNSGTQNISGSTKLIVKEKKYGSSSLEFACSGIIERVCTNEDYFPEDNSASIVASENISSPATIAQNTPEQIEGKSVLPSSENTVELESNPQNCGKTLLTETDFTDKQTNSSKKLLKKMVQESDYLADTVEDKSIIQKSSKTTEKRKSEAKTKDDVQGSGEAFLTEGKIYEDDNLNNTGDAELSLPEANVSKDNEAFVKAAEDSVSEECMQKIPKKRGRKRKEIKIEENIPQSVENLSQDYLQESDGMLLIEGTQSEANTSNDGETITEVVEDSCNVESMQKTPKKRGRKRKIKSEESNDDYMPEVDEEEKSHKRKRKRVNYSALNSGNEYGDTFGAEKYQNFQKRKGKQAGQVTVKMFNSLFENFNTSVLNPNTSIIESEMKDVQGGITDVNVDINSAPSSNATSGEVEDNSISVNDAASENNIDLLLPVAEPSPSNRGRGRGRGRPRKNFEQVKTEDMTRPVTCAVCHLHMPGINWPHHKLRFHNNLTWRVGDTPLDLNNKDLVMNILNEMYRQKKPLHCEKCGDKKKSVLGYLSHKSICQKTTEEINATKIQCEQCGALVLPVSMTSHIKLVHTEKFAFVQSTNVETADKEVVGTDGKYKRKAAKKANNMIQNIAKDVDVDGVVVPKRFVASSVKYVQTNKGTKDLLKLFQQKRTLKCMFGECGYFVNSKDEFVRHVLQCPAQPESVQICKTCFIAFGSNRELCEHFREEHVTEEDAVIFGDASENEDDEREETQDIVVKKPRPHYRPSTRGDYPSFISPFRSLRNRNTVFTPAYKWTLNFYESNFYNTNLFANWKALEENWEEIPEEILEKYSPELSHSIDVCFRKVEGFVDINDSDYEWKKLELFETQILEDGSATTFCGGPISSLAWAPTPHKSDNVDQILAVSIELNMNKRFYITKHYTDPGLIQFWNFGKLSNKEKKANIPKLEFCICHDYGYIRHMEWCPSGCYDLENVEDNPGVLKRLGLLAVAGSDSFVYIYAVPAPVEDGAVLMKPLPILKLRLQIETGVHMRKKRNVSKLGWTKATGHRYLAVGYSDGMVAIFDLTTESPMLKIENDENGIPQLLPMQYFQAHGTTVTVVHLYHLNDGKRWLFTASHDKVCKFWDLQNNIFPISSYKKIAVSDGVWLSHWISIVMSFEETGVMGFNPSYVYQFREHTSEPNPIMYSSSTIKACSGSEWLNGFVQGNSAGEIIGFLPHQLYFGLENDKPLKNKKFLIGYSGIVQKGLPKEERQELDRKKEEAMKNKLKHIPFVEEDEETHDPTKMNFNPHYNWYDPLTYQEADEKYGLVFCDRKMNWSTPEGHKDLSKTSSKLSYHYFNMYPLKQVNKIAFNPNRHSYLYFTTGYQTGFLRTFCLNFLD